jgi:uncharacterized protein YggE
MSNPTPVPQVAVRGEALLLVEPEVADIDLTVRGRGRDRETALERCRARQSEVTEVATAAGDAVETVETTGAAVHPETGDRGAMTSVASIHTRLTVGRLDAVGDLVVAFGRLDDVEVFGPMWRLRPTSPSIEEARMAAVRDALHRARQYARAFGAELIALLSVSDTGLSAGGPRFAAPMAAVARFEVGEPRFDLAPARQEVHGAVEVRFAMSEPAVSFRTEEVYRG